MNLNEHQAKSILRELGFAIPAGVVCDSPELAEVLAATLDTDKWVVKAQIFAGGRARGRLLLDSTNNIAATRAAKKSSKPIGQGGVRFAHSIGQVVQHCRELIGETLVTAQTGEAGEQIRQVYLEERLEVVRELYLALTIDPQQGQLALIVSQQGGSNIEVLASAQPEAVQHFLIPLDQPFTQQQALAEALGLDLAQQQALDECLQRALQRFVEKDMLLIEINPLAVVDSGELVALDAMVVFDDNALFRQGHSEQMEAYQHLPEQEYRAVVQGLNLVKLKGDIATLSSGAGLAMATIDAICENGGSPANFLDVPPSTAVRRLSDALALLLNDPNTACLLVNVFGGGIMRCDAVADALLLAYRKKPFAVPVVVRLAGTNAELGRQRLAASLPEVMLAPDLAEAARTCCAYTADLKPTVASNTTDLPNVNESAGAGSGKLWNRLRRLIPD